VCHPPLCVKDAKPAERIVSGNVATSSAEPCWKGATRIVNALSFGEVLWDLIEGREYIGGAPFNLAAHLARCGAEVAMLTRIGADARGERAHSEIRRLGVQDDFVQVDPEHPTGWAKVQLDDQGVATFQFPEHPAYDFIQVDDRVLRQLSDRQLDVVCFGTLAQRGGATRQSLYRLLDAVQAQHVFYDVNIRLDYYPKSVLCASLQRSTIVKLNADESVLLCRRLYERKLPEDGFAERLLADYLLDVVCVTKEADGCTVYTGDETCDVSAPSVQVADTVGAGDAFSAGFLRAYCGGETIDHAAITANALGAYVASCPGAIPPYNDTIRQKLGLG